MLEPDDEKTKRRDYFVGQPLDPLSVDELHDAIARLESEILRLKDEIERKSAQRRAADLLFRS